MEGRRLLVWVGDKLQLTDFHNDSIYQTNKVSLQLEFELCMYGQASPIKAFSTALRQSSSIKAFAALSISPVLNFMASSPSLLHKVVYFENLQDYHRSNLCICSANFSFQPSIAMAAKKSIILFP